MRRVLAFAFLCAVSAAAAADTVHLRHASVGARVRSFDRASVVYEEGCSQGAIRTVAWSEVAALTFSGGCSQAAAPNPAPPPEGCANPLDSFLVTFSGASPEFPVEDAMLAPGRLLHLSVYTPWETAHGPVDEVAQVRRGLVCREANLSPPEYPGGYCHEPRQVAVAFDYRNPLNNRIFTNGFSFVVRMSGTPPAQFDLERFGEEVRSAFQAGISIWTFSMSDRDALLSPSVRAFIKSRTSQAEGSKYILQTPPQVLRLQCPQAATFVVELDFAEDDLFPRFPLVLARARIEGRTIALNMRQIPCYRSELKYDDKKRLAFDMADGCINLVPIMTHELGHAFGLVHIDDAAHHSLMDSTFSRDALSPTDRDIVMLVAALERSIAGASPGVLEFISSDGVRPPLDWSPRARRGGS